MDLISGPLWMNFLPNICNLSEDNAINFNPFFQLNYSKKYVLDLNILWEILYHFSVWILELQ